MVLRRTLLVLVGMFLLTGCAGLIGGDPSRLVLTHADVPPGLVELASGPYNNEQVAATFNLQPDQVVKTLGRTGGYRVRFARLNPHGSGPARIDSVVSLYRGAVPASKALAFEVRANLAVQPAMQAVNTPRIGDESRVFAWTEQDPQHHSYRFVSIYWRQANALGAIAAAGAEGDFNLEDALRLAQRQAAYIKAAR